MLEVAPPLVTSGPEQLQRLVEDVQTHLETPMALVDILQPLQDLPLQALVFVLAIAARALERPQAGVRPQASVRSQMTRALPAPPALAGPQARARPPQVGALLAVATLKAPVESDSLDS